MKLQLDHPVGHHLITGYGDGYVEINGVRYASNLVVLPDRLLEAWASEGFDALSAGHFEQLRDVGAEVILLGTGRRQRFPAPSLLRPLIEARAGFEIMDFMAACRTYNVLVAEGRKVAAALLID